MPLRPGTRNLAAIFEVEDGPSFQVDTAGDGIILFGDGSAGCW